jgi:hypothetical protein
LGSIGDLVVSLLALVLLLTVTAALQSKSIQSSIRLLIECIIVDVPNIEGIPAIPTHNTTPVISFSNPAGFFVGDADLDE